MERSWSATPPSASAPCTPRPATSQCSESGPLSVARSRRRRTSAPASTPSPSSATSCGGPSSEAGRTSWEPSSRSTARPTRWSASRPRRSGIIVSGSPRRISGCRWCSIRCLRGQRTGLPIATRPGWRRSAGSGRARPSARRARRWRRCSKGWQRRTRTPTVSAAPLLRRSARCPPATERRFRLASQRFWQPVPSCCSSSARTSRA